MYMDSLDVMYSTVCLASVAYEITCLVMCAMFKTARLLDGIVVSLEKKVAS